MADQFLTLLEAEKPSITAMLPEHIGADRWWALTVEVAKSKDLQRIAQSNPMSLIAAIKKIADWGLELDGEEALIIPYADSAEAQAMYKGLIRRVIEAGVAAHIYAELVREGEPIEVVSGSTRELKHTSNPFKTDAKVIGAYAVAILADGLTDFEIFNSKDIEACKAAALRMAQRRKKPGEDAKDSPAWRFFEGEMAKKSVIRRLCKRLRGKRDNEAGRRYGSLLSNDKAYDAETTAVTSRADEIDNPPPLTPEVVAPEVQGSIGTESSEYKDIMSFAKAAGVKMGELCNLAEMKFSVSGPDELTAAQVPHFIKEMQAVAGAGAK